MTGKLITNANQISAEWLTGILKESGALLEGTVAAVQLESDRGNWSMNATLTVTYFDGARGTLPQQLFLKMVDTDTGDGEFFGDSEIIYYTRDYIDVTDAPLLKCFDAVYSEERHRYHLLLENVAATHIVAAEKEPTLEYCLALVEGLAILQPVGGVNSG